jgi:uncharacterized damage-inducible protein DinB
MFLDAIVRLYDYQREVNKHILDVAEQLSSDELTSPDGTSAPMGYLQRSGSSRRRIFLA